MKKRFMRNLMLVVGIFSFIVWSCNDDFTEEDLLQRQADINLQMQKHADSMNLRRVQYTITVYNASTVSANTGGRTEGLSGLENALVNISINGLSQAQSTDVNGIVVFENIPQGSISGTVTLESFTTIHFIASLFDYNEIEDPVISAGTMVPMFEASGPNMANIAGKATYEGNLLNSTEEDVPDGTLVSFNINTLDPSFITAYLSREEGKDIGSLTSIAIEDDFATKVADGEYSIQLPAAPQGLVYNISFSDFMADQTIAINNYSNEAIGSVRDVVIIPTHFTQNTSISLPNSVLNEKFLYIPTVSSVLVDIEAPPAQGSGAAMIPRLVATSSGLGFDVLAGGSGYAPNATDIPITVSAGDYDASIPGATPAHLVGWTDANGRLSIVIANESGHGYRTRPTLTVGGAGTGAVAVSVYESGLSPLNSTLTSGGTGYVLSPEVVFQGIDIFGQTVTVTGTTEILNGSVVSVNFPPGNFATTPTATFVSAAREFAEGSSFIIDGEISSVFLIDNGEGYNPSLAPSVTIRDLRGTGTGASAIANVNISGQVSELILTGAGANYSQVNANYPEFSTAFFIKSSLENGNPLNLQNTVQVKPGVTRIIDAYYGTGIKTRGVE